MSVPKNCSVGNWQMLYLYSKNRELCMGPCDLSTIVPKSINLIFPHLKLIKLLCRHHICSPCLRDSPRDVPPVRRSGNNHIFPTITIENGPKMWK